MAVGARWLRTAGDLPAITCFQALARSFATARSSIGIAMWTIGVSGKVFLQTVLFGLLVPPERVQNRFGFWFAVTAYTSYPLLPVGVGDHPVEPPIILPVLGSETNLFPFTFFFGGHMAILTSIVSNLWWIDLAVTPSRSDARRQVAASTRFLSES